MLAAVVHVHGLVAQTDPDVSVPFCRTEGMSEDATLDKNKGSLKQPRLRWSAILAKATNLGIGGECCRSQQQVQVQTYEPNV